MLSSNTRIAPLVCLCGIHGDGMWPVREMLIGDSVKQSGSSPICMPTILKYFLTRIAAVLRGRGRGGFESVLEILHASHGSGRGLFSLLAQPPLSRCCLMADDVTACVRLEFVCLSSKLWVVRPFSLARVQLLQLWFHRFLLAGQRRGSLLH